ncbi:unnamed protein product [Rotaria sordida]|uniref:EF-hand domain-containing protein n=2 Tax=Rotaria sordida TaxID=392033 RepID=A0A815DYV9_9BILA|nr:unnamed protein product [Rotaria sordida]CAF1305020.1 unnamed protein product [Rotaria sordida]CAF1371821.1 unnamed protein product [Rotaria sordida]CAF1576758.1 unnamed protein product [Rotaria sordida]CAF1576902.1 unnamed protein product [Rotaria sordida]
MSATPTIKLGTGRELTAEDMEEFWRENPDGIMTDATYKKFYQKQKEDSIVRKFPREIAFALFDSNNDKKIDFVEFLMANAFASSNSRREALDYLFDLCDTSLDERMDMIELAAFNAIIASSVKETQNVSAYETMKVAGKIFNFIGLNAEKKLTKEQFIKECEKVPLIKRMFKIKK